MKHKGLLPYDYYVAEKMGTGFTVPRGVRDKMWGFGAEFCGCVQSGANGGSELLFRVLDI